jgi:hypothetical protein
MRTIRQSSKPRFPKWLVSGSVIALCFTVWSGSARAYRPFDGTDAAVAAPGELEIELQPAGRLRESGTTTLIAPATVINYGLSEGWEAVFEGQGQTPLSPSGPDQPDDGGSIPQACAAARQSAGQNRPQYRDRVWRPASGQHGEFRRRREPGRDRLAALGMGNGPLECGDCVHPRPSR